jgi:spore coat polysaccharide biosynthesis protein SpsF (cytidylyltransferase family)
MKTGILIQARMNSTRLPGKVLMPFAGDLCILEILALRLKTLGLPMIICTSDDPSDDAVAILGDTIQLPVFRGSQHDVLDRFIGAADAFECEKIVRVCADNPFLDAEFLQALIAFSDENPADYWSYQDKLGTPSIKTHSGLFGEVVKTSVLRDVAAQTDDPLYREHVTNFVYSSGLYQCRFLPIPGWIPAELRLTVDDQLDFDLAAQLYLTQQQKGLNLPGLLQHIDDSGALQAMKSNIQKYSK